VKHREFSTIERVLALLAGLCNLLVGLGFFFLPELHLPLWPTSIPDVLDRFIGAIILGNAVGACWLATEKEWARVRALALVATVYGTLVALALLYHLLWLHAAPAFWLYLAFDLPFLLVYYALFLYHELGLFARKADAHRQAHARVG
jgi:O-antigen/teichoic acid export membrane protein